MYKSIKKIAASKLTQKFDERGKTLLQRRVEIERAAKSASVEVKGSRDLAAAKRA